MSQLYVFCRIFVVYVTIVCLLSCTQAGRPPRGGRGCGAAGGKLYILPHHCCTESKMPVSLLFSYRALEVAEVVQQLVVHILTLHIMLHRIKDACVFTFCALTRRWRWRRVWSSWWQIINLATSLLHRIKDACVSFFCFHTGCWRWRRVCSSWWHIF